METAQLDHGGELGLGPLTCFELSKPQQTGFDGFESDCFIAHMWCRPMVTPDPCSSAGIVVTSSGFCDLLMLSPQQKTSSLDLTMQMWET